MQGAHGLPYQRDDEEEEGEGAAFIGKQIGGDRPGHRDNSEEDSRGQHEGCEEPPRGHGIQVRACFWSADGGKIGNFRAIPAAHFIREREHEGPQFFSVGQRQPPDLYFFSTGGNSEAGLAHQPGEEFLGDIHALDTIPAHVAVLFEQHAAAHMHPVRIEHPGHMPPLDGRDDPGNEGDYHRDTHRDQPEGTQQINNITPDHSGRIGILQALNNQPAARDQHEEPQREQRTPRRPFRDRLPGARDRGATHSGCNG